jgi:hypothetical protein
MLLAVMILSQQSEEINVINTKKSKSCIAVCPRYVRNEASEKLGLIPKINPLPTIWSA